MAIWGAVVGVLGAGLPQLLKMLQDRQDKKHELEILRIQAELQAQGHTQRMEEVHTQGDIEAMKALYKMSETKEFTPTGSGFTDSITRILEILLYVHRSAVQPNVTYAMLSFYGLIKYAQFSVAMTMGSVSTLDALLTIWTQFDQEALAAVISYWFTGRMFQRAGSYQKK